MSPTRVPEQPTDALVGHSCDPRGRLYVRSSSTRQFSIVSAAPRTPSWPVTIPATLEVEKQTPRKNPLIPLTDLSRSRESVPNSVWS